MNKFDLVITPKEKFIFLNNALIYSTDANAKDADDLFVSIAKASNEPVKAYFLGSKNEGDYIALTGDIDLNYSIESVLLYLEKSKQKALMMEFHYKDSTNPILVDVSSLITDEDIFDIEYFIQSTVSDTGKEGVQDLSDSDLSDMIVNTIKETYKTSLYPYYDASIWVEDLAVWAGNLAIWVAMNAPQYKDIIPLSKFHSIGLDISKDGEDCSDFFLADMIQQLLLVENNPSKKAITHQDIIAIEALNTYGSTENFLKALLEKWNNNCDCDPLENDPFDYVKTYFFGTDGVELDKFTVTYLSQYTLISFIDAYF